MQLTQKANFTDCTGRNVPEYQNYYTQSTNGILKIWLAAKLNLS